MTAAGTQLRAAADLIRDRGLAKGATSLPDGSICTMRALGAVSDTVAEMGALRHRVLAAIGQPGLPFLSEWNDDPDRTEEEVVAAFEAAADVADAEVVAA